jgi:hypothetical protein
MMRPARLTLAFGVFAAAIVAPIHAQERLGSMAAADQQRFAGWTFTPTFGFGEMYDDNVALFGARTAEGETNDYVATFFPGADLRYTGHHTSFGTRYTGSFLDYRTFSTLNRWDQRAGIDLKREESAHFKWFADASAAALPSTDLIELGGIPFRQTGAQTLETRGGMDYILDARNQVSTSLRYQDIKFDRSLLGDDVLRGGHIVESTSSYRYRLAARTAIGADYTYSHVDVVGDITPFDIHSAMGAADYELSPAWTLSGGAGIVYLQGTPFSPAHNSPTGRVSLDRRRGGTTFHVGYLRSFIPSFGFGGTSSNQEVGVAFRTPLFNNRHLYTVQSGVFRDDTPLTDLAFQLPLRSLRTYSIIGWQADRWVRLEGFYARVQQTSLRPGGQAYRNQVGFQIVTSKPMRIQ